MKYYQLQQAETLKWLEKEKAGLPNFCHRFLLSVSPKTTPRTQVAYAQDLRLFCQFLTTKVRELIGTPIIDLNVKDLAMLEVWHIESYVQYLSRYVTPDGKTYCNAHSSKKRKMVTIRALFRYLFKIGDIAVNIIPKVDVPRCQSKSIVPLNDNEVNQILDIVTNDAAWRKRQRYREKTELRDYAILMFFFTTGIRTAELVALDVDDIDLDTKSFKITRSTGEEGIYYMSPELCDVMYNYLKERSTDDSNGKYNSLVFGICSVPSTLPTKTGNPLFRSLHKTRFSTGQICTIIRRYAKIALPLKQVCSRTIRNTYGANIYHATSNVDLVADLLGWRSPETVRRLTPISEIERKEAAMKVTIKSKYNHSVQ